MILKSTAGSRDGEMQNKYEMLRKKMARFNEWEATNRKTLTTEKRLEQFLALYELGSVSGEETIKRAHEEHLKGIIETNKRLRG
jgi:hypothetical protein